MAVISKDSVVMRLARNAKTYDIEFEKRNAILEEKETLIDLNRSQLRQGIDAEGTTFGPYASLKYAKFKQALSSYKAKFPTPDLFLTGKLQNEMDLKISGNQVEIFSKDPESNKKLFGQYREAFGIAPGVQKIAVVEVTETFNRNTRKKLFD